MSISAVANHLWTTYWRPISLTHFPLLMQVIICWAIERMIVSNFDWMRCICLGSIFFCLDRSCPASWVLRPRVLIAHQLLIDCARYQRMIGVRTRSCPMHCTLQGRHFGRIIIAKIPCDDVVKCCTFDIIKWRNTHQIFACVCLAMYQWSSCSWDKFLKLSI